MTKLAIDGGEPAVEGAIKPFRTIGEEEVAAAAGAIRSGPLSGYLGGERHGGLRVEALEHEFQDLFKVKHAVAVNSATSGLLAACAAVGVAPYRTVVVSPYTMSATAAAPAMLSADIVFGDIQAKTFSIDTDPCGYPLAIIVTNLFGHPAHLKNWREYCDDNGIYLIEDNAQAPFAMEGDKYAGTVGHIGVFSLNVHKHIQCGEGGVCVTEDDDLADRIRLFRNHGELGSNLVGLNLRMTEVTAAIALAQLAKHKSIIDGRIELAEQLTGMVAPYGGIRPPMVREGCKHVYYCWAAIIHSDRDWFVDAMQAEGVPLRKGYIQPLHRMGVFPGGKCPITDFVEDRIALFEICAHDPTDNQRKGMTSAFAKVGEALEKRRSAPTHAAEHGHMHPGHTQELGDSP